MKNKRRKMLPSQPKWFWYGEPCWNCPNRNSCGNCKASKAALADQKEKQNRKEKQNLNKALW